jgi:sugar phosphate isomerase/epimerase
MMVVYIRISMSLIYKNPTTGLDTIEDNKDATNITFLLDTPHVQK